MTTRRSLAIVVIFSSLLISSNVNADEIKKKQSELQRLKNEISDYEKKIKDKEKKEHATLELLDTYDHQSLLLQQLVKKLREEEKSLQSDIDSTRQTIVSLTSRLDFLKNHYAHYVSSVYKTGQTYDLELLLSSKSLNQLLIRAEYLRRFSDQRKKDLDRIGTQRDEYEDQRDLLQRQLAEREDLERDKTNEEQLLVRKMKKRKSLLTEIRKDKKNYQREINRKMEAAKEMEKLIAKLIEDEQQRKEHEKSRSGEKKYSGESESAAGTAFAARRGTLRWPVSSGKIVSRFGSQEHPSLHTVTQNTGIDIAIPTGTAVNAVADGEISIISWLPSFGNLVIVNHKNGYRTVYAHLSEINVKEGEAVKEGEQLGQSGEALSGPLLHFEIYKDREKQDPEQWLRQRGVTQR